LWAVPTALIGSALATLGFRWFHKPTPFTPTEENLHIATLIPQHSPDASKKTILNITALKQKIQEEKILGTCIDIGNRVIDIYSGTPQSSVLKHNSAPTRTNKILAKTNKTLSNMQENTIAADSSSECPIWIVSPGFMGHRPQKYSQQPEPESGLEQATHFITANMIHGPCLSFDYNDNRRVFNFAQQTDICCLKKVFDTIKQQDCILIGTCRGATTILQMLTQLPAQELAHIKAVILESPALNLQSLATQVAHSYVDWLPKSPFFIHTFFKFWFPNYDPHFPSFLDKLDHLPRNLPILIGHLENDRVISYGDIAAVVQKLRETGHTQLYLVKVHDAKITHARLSKIPSFTQAVNAFLQHYKLPHDTHLAKLGENALALAKIS
jgi:hypothetical protein